MSNAANRKERHKIATCSLRELAGLITNLDTLAAAPADLRLYILAELERRSKQSGRRLALGGGFAAARSWMRF